jgi:hypothetical protein
MKRVLPAREIVMVGSRNIKFRHIRPSLRA